MGCAGDPVVQTPHLDRLASEGVRFDRAFCQGPLCQPARASLLTERFVRDHGLPGIGAVDHELPTIVQKVREAGYHTACIGKMHFEHGRPAHMRDPSESTRAYGFVEAIETTGPLGSARVDSEYTDYLGAKGLLETHRDFMRKYSPAAGQRTIEAGILLNADPNPLPPEDYIDAWHGRRVVQWIKDYDRDEPFFLWVGFPGPHDPWDAPASYVDRYRDADMPMPASLKRPELPEPGPMRAFLEMMFHYCGTDDMTDDVIRSVRRAYYANVTIIDEAIGKICSALADKGMLDDTWVIYTSDHGEQMGEHRMLSKMVPYEHAVRVPLIMRPPEGIDGRVVDSMVGHIDLSATVRDIAGASSDPGFSGHSLLGHTDGGQGFERDVVFSQCWGFAMARTDRYKLVVHENTLRPEQLFDLEADPTEDENLVDVPVRAADLERLMEEHMRPFLGQRKQRPADPLSDPFAGDWALRPGQIPRSRVSP